jgi:hypothetical protein
MHSLFHGEFTGQTLAGRRRSCDYSLAVSTQSHRISRHGIGFLEKSLSE